MNVSVTCFSATPEGYSVSDVLTAQIGAGQNRSFCECANTLTGDINNDGVVDMKDISYVARRFNIDPASPLWDPKADVVSDGRIDMKDISLVARHFGEHI